VIYDNLGEAHGYLRMEELARIERAGLPDSATKINYELQWEISKDLGGITEGVTKPELRTSKWEKVDFDSIGKILKKRNGVQVKASPTSLVTWYMAYRTFHT
jgi:hypothetical protein